jgi:hypothetical protein
MTEPSTKAASDAAIEATPALEPSAADIDEWAARQRRRRVAWLKGPTEE